MRGAPVVLDPVVQLSVGWRLGAGELGLLSYELDTIPAG